jgi:hypothetical protein
MIDGVASRQDSSDVRYFTYISSAQWIKMKMKSIPCGINATASMGNRSRRTYFGQSKSGYYVYVPIHPKIVWATLFNY